MNNYQKVVIVDFKKLNDFKSFNVRYTDFNINFKKIFNSLENIIKDV